jgi:hypothetical protein
VGSTRQAIATRNMKEIGQRAWAALAGMTTWICGRYSAEARAIKVFCTVSEPDRALSTYLARLLIQRARSDARFASGFVPWLAAAQMLLSGILGEW